MIALPAVTAAFFASSLQAQALSDTSARIRGAAISSYNGLPIAGVMISAPEVRKFVVTDANGQFALAGLPTGRRSIRVSYEGRETHDYVFILQGQRTKQIAVVLDVDAVNLDPLVVEARQANTWRDLAGFYERRREYRGFAHFFTREEITRMQPTRLSPIAEILGRNALFTGRSTLGSLSLGSRARGPWPPCAPPEQLDGVRAGVEVYRGVPPNDLDHSLVPSVGSSIWMGTGLSAAGSCGLVEIWTR